MPLPPAKGSFKTAIDKAVRRTDKQSDKLAIAGRYHQSPRCLEDDYALTADELGSGYGGKVLLATSRHSKGKFAVKVIDTHGMCEDRREELESSVEVFLGLDHPNVLRLVDVYESDSQLSLVTECLEGGELFDRVVEKSCFSEKDAAGTTWQMLLAVNYLHSHGIVHRDVKLENFLYERRNSEHLKLIDFGFSMFWDQSTKLDVSCGSLSYVAPEVLNRSYTSQCDVWSLGVVVFILLAGYMPFDGPETERVEAIKLGTYEVRDTRWSRISATATDFVRKLLVVDPAQRLTTEQALQHPWMLQSGPCGCAAGRSSRLLRAPSCAPVQTGHRHVKGIMEALCSFASLPAFRRACMLMMAWSLSDVDRAQVRHIFLELDQSRRGMIELSELEKLLSTKYVFSADEVARIIKVLGNSHGGAIHYSEFLAAMVAPQIGLHDDLLRTTFRQFDTERCGLITSHSLRQVLGDSFEGFAMKELLSQATQPSSVSEAIDARGIPSVDTQFAGNSVIRDEGLTFEGFASFLRSGVTVPSCRGKREADFFDDLFSAPSSKRRRMRSRSSSFRRPWTASSWDDDPDFGCTGGDCSLQRSLPSGIEGSGTADSTSQWTTSVPNITVPSALAGSTTGAGPFCFSHSSSGSTSSSIVASSVAAVSDGRFAQPVPAAASAADANDADIVTECAQRQWRGHVIEEEDDSPRFASDPQAWEDEDFFPRGSASRKW